MASEYASLIKDYSCDSNEALWVLSSKFNRTDASASYEDTLQLFRESGWLPGTDSSPQPVEVPYIQEFTTKTEEIFADKTELSNSVTKLVSDALEQHPELEGTIQEVCEFFFEGLSDGTWLMQSDFDQLLQDYTSALEIGIQAVVSEGADSYTAYEKMRDFLAAYYEEE